MDVLIVFAVAAVAAGSYYVSVRLHPNTLCRKGWGNGRNAGSTASSSNEANPSAHPDKITERKRIRQMRNIGRGLPLWAR
jgi:hypothetical protein